MRFEEALAAPGRLVQVWGEEITDGRRVQAIYSLTDVGAKQLAWRSVPAAQYDALVEELNARGIAIAGTEATCEYVWIITATGVEVYGRRSKVLDAEGDRATLEDGSVIPRADIARIVSFAEPDHVYRGIKAELRSGQAIGLVTEFSTAADAGAGYSRNDLLMETGWTSTLGVAIATWAGAAFHDQIVG